MFYEPLYERLPEVAEEETRTLIIRNDPVLPDGDYGLVEAYCNDPGCDCRRVLLNVYNWQSRETVAVIAYGWESRAYYVEWFGDDNPQIISEIKGPALNSASHQSALAPAFLRLVTTVLKDQKYVARLQRHYRMFKDSINSEGTATSHTIQAKVGRNEPCPCGSGKKYKRCCGSRKL
ncbi:MAG: SEC-C metal-binding domain-containing protein [Anaerolineales bacterium]